MQPQATGSNPLSCNIICLSVRLYIYPSACMSVRLSGCPVVQASSRPRAFYDFRICIIFPEWGASVVMNFLMIAAFGTSWEIISVGVASASHMEDHWLYSCIFPFNTTGMKRYLYLFASRSGEYSGCQYYTHTIKIFSDNKSYVPHLITLLLIWEVGQS